MNSPVDVYVNVSVRGLCIEAYPGHKNGCPNYNKKLGCPPAAPRIQDIIWLDRPVVAIWVEFDLARHRKRMLTKHPKWSRRQADCCLYWQNGVRRDLRIDANEWLRYQADPYLIIVDCPEANGVDVTATMRTAGIELEWPPVNIVRKVVLCGTRVGAIQ